MIKKILKITASLTAALGFTALGFVVGHLYTKDIEALIVCALYDREPYLPAKACEYSLYYLRDTEQDVKIMTGRAGLGYILVSKNKETRRRIAEFFIANGLSVDSVNRRLGSNFTALHSAVHGDDIEAVRFLLSYGANINITRAESLCRGKVRMTPLGQAQLDRFLEDNENFPCDNDRPLESQWERFLENNENFPMDNDNDRTAIIQLLTYETLKQKGNIYDQDVNIYDLWTIERISDDDYSDARVIEKGNFLEIDENDIVEVIKDHGKRRHSYIREGRKLKLTMYGNMVTWKILLLKQNEMHILTGLGVYVLKRGGDD